MTATLDRPAPATGSRAEGPAAVLVPRPAVPLAARLLPRSPITRAALGVWALTRVMYGLASLAAANVTPPAAPGPGAPHGLVLPQWQSWDAHWFAYIARWGYLRTSDAAEPYACCTHAFFPGTPLAIRAVHLLVPSYTAAGLAVSALAGGVAAVALARLSVRATGLAGPAASRLAGAVVAAWALSPFGVFLAAGYSEALFLACALPAWLCARQGSWRAAGLLAGGAALVRVNGLFLAAALALMLLQRAWRSPRRLLADGVWLLAPVVSVGAYVAYLHARTGDWQAWQHAQQRAWFRTTTGPLQSLRETLAILRDPFWTTDYQWSRLFELATMAVGLVVLALLARRRDWPSTLYVLLTLAALGTSGVYISLTRSTLLLWPAWLVLAGALARRPGLRDVWLAVAAPLALLLCAAFVTGRWVA